LEGDTSPNLKEEERVLPDPCAFGRRVINPTRAERGKIPEKRKGEKGKESLARLEKKEDGAGRSSLKVMRGKKKGSITFRFKKKN